VVEEASLLQEVEEASFLQEVEEEHRGLLEQRAEMLQEVQQE